MNKLRFIYVQDLDQYMVPYTEDVIMTGNDNYLVCRNTILCICMIHLYFSSYIFNISMEYNVILQVNQ